MPLDIQTRLSEAYQDLYQAAFNSAIYWYGEASRALQSRVECCKDAVCYGTECSCLDLDKIV